MALGLTISPKHFVSLNVNFRNEKIPYNHLYNVVIFWLWKQRRIGNSQEC